MKRFRSLIGVCLLGLGFHPATALAQTPAKAEPDPGAIEVGPANTPRQRVGRIIVPEKVPAAMNSATAVRPVRLERDPLSPEVKDRVLNFDKYRAEYLKQQEQILKRIKGTTDRDRELIREQLNKELRERWLEQLATTREEFRERKKELLDRLPNHRELLESAREQSRDALRDQRERRGVDK
jgi:hypothetical protein